MVDKIKQYIPFVIIFSIFIGSIAMISTYDGDLSDARTSVIHAVSAEPLQMIYNIPADSDDVHFETVKSGQVISGMLAPYGISSDKIHQMAAYNQILDAGKIISGNTYCIITDDKGSATHFIYEKNKIDYAVFNFTDDNVKCYAGKKPVETKMRSVGGVIEGSVYETLVAHNADPILANALAEIFAYNLDFYKVNRGDIFKLYYSEIYVDGEYVGIDSVHAAYMQHRNSDFYAFQYTQDGVTGYFDETGKSLKKAFLQAPLKYTRISSKYSKNRFHPVQKRFKAHLGTDYAAPTGTPIYTVGDGTVIEKGYTSGNGNYVKIKHNATYTTQYLHMSKFASGLSKGDRVTQGEVIGYVGSTGLATGPHLCYRFWKNGVQVDPFQEKIPPSFPVKAAMLDTYRAMAGKEMRILENTPVNLAPEEKVIHEYIVMLDTLGVLPAIQFLIPSSIGI